MGRSTAFSAGLLALMLAATGLAAPQSTSKHPTSKSSNATTANTNAANSWMMIPTPYSARSADIMESTRAERDRIFDDAIGQRVPLTSKTVEATVIPEGDFFGNPPEIPKVPNRAILTATFTKHRSILSASERSVYTEVTFEVQEVFRFQRESPFPGGEITVSLAGGTVITPSGQVVSYLTQPRELFLQPGKKYLLVLSHHNAGDFYTLADDWDISDGTVRANNKVDQQRARAGLSSLSGLSTDQLGPALDRLLSAETQ